MAELNEIIMAADAIRKSNVNGPKILYRIIEVLISQTQQFLLFMLSVQIPRVVLQLKQLLVLMNVLLNILFILRSFAEI